MTRVAKHLPWSGSGALGLLLVLATGCGKPPAVAPPEAPRVPEVQTVHPLRQSLARRVEQPARIEAFEVTPIHAKIPGYVKVVNVEIGTRVGKNDVLAELWVPEQEEELKQKEAEVKLAGVAIKQAEKALVVTRTTIATAKSLVAEARASRKRAEASYERWKSESKRMDRLVRSKVIAPESRDEVLNQFRAAGATVEETAARILSTQAMQAEAEAKYAKAEIDLEASQVHLRLAEAHQRRVAALLAYAKIRAPYDGVVTQRHVHTNHFVQPAAGTTGKPLFVVARTDKVRVFLDVPERDAVLVQARGPARIRVPVLNDAEFTGTVAGSSFALDSLQRTLRTEVDFDNPGERLRPGMYAHATLDVVDRRAMTLPAAAILTRDGEPYCFCVDVNKRAARLPLRIGIRQGDVVEVLKKRRRSGTARRWEDLTGEEEVIVASPGELSTGQQVQVAAEAPAPAAAAGQ